MISIDTKKKEKAGNYAANGTEYRAKGSEREVNDHDFATETMVPYGLYVLNNNTGFVNLGCSSDTSKFAVESIRRWWNQTGSKSFPNAKFLLVTADGGGSNGSNRRMFK